MYENEYRMHSFCVQNDTGASENSSKLLVKLNIRLPLVLVIQGKYWHVSTWYSDRSFLHNHWTPETVFVFIFRLMNGQFSPVHAMEYDPAITGKRITNTWTNLRGTVLREKRTESKASSYLIAFRTLWKEKHDRVSGCWGLGKKRRFWFPKGTRDVLRWWKYSLCWLCCWFQNCVCCQISYNCKSKIGDFIVYKSHLKDFCKKPLTLLIKVRHIW